MFGIIFEELHHRVGVVSGQQGPDLLVLLLQPIPADLLERSDEEGDHVLEDARPDHAGLVGHGTVLDRPCKQDHIPCLGTHLDCLLEELFLIVRMPRVNMRARNNCCGSIIRSEVCYEGDNLESEEMVGWKIHTTFSLGPKVTIVRIVKMRSLTIHTRHHGVGGQAGQAAPGAKQPPPHLQDDWVRRNLGKDLTSGEQAPCQACVVVVTVVSVNKPVRLSKLVLEDSLLGHLYVGVAEHALEDHPTITMSDFLTNLLKVVTSRISPVANDNIIVSVLEDSRAGAHFGHGEPELQDPDDIHLAL